MGLRLIQIIACSFFSLFFLSHADDTSIMLELRSLISPIPSSSWSSSNSYCNWSGVKCDNSSRVTSINLASKSLSGTLPFNLSSLSQLTSLSLQNNNFNGLVPLLSDLQFLHEIHLDSNRLSYILGNAFDNLPRLRTLTINHNPSLTPWELPDLSSSSELAIFEAMNASMIGTLPYWVGYIRVLRLSHNRLTGVDFFGYGNSIEILWLDHQQPGISDSLDFLTTTTELAQVWLNNNSFNGSIPDLTNCDKIFDLQLSDNQLLGFVPASLFSLPNLRNISLQNNNLYGPYPNFSSTVKVETGKTFCSDKPGVPCDKQVVALLDAMPALGNPMQLVQAWKGKDLCKWQFISCNKDGNVTTVNLAGQQLVGSIPTSLGNLTALLDLYLNDNELYGSIPESITLLPQLKVFDVSNNYLNGMMPKFQSSVRVNVTGNMFVVDDSTFEAASASNEDIQNRTSALSFIDTTHSSSILGVKMKSFILVCVALATVAVLAIFTILWFVLKRRHANQWEEDPEEQLKVGLGALLRRFSYETLKSVTENFDPKKKLGGGGFGSVYEGTLVEGTKVAVKRLDRLGQGRKEFVAEVTTLGSIHHVNLVKLIGFCDENAYRVLVYEHMSNGSLDKWIFRKHEQLGFDLLSWNTRKKIILQITKGLAYLHEECQHRIVHLDIKPENILLDGNFNAKVADFGLAKLIDRNESFAMTQMRGTRGYLAPEWLSRKITEKADVYSFGIVLLEIIFERRNLEYSIHYEEEGEEESSNELLVHLVNKKAEANRLTDLVEGFYQGDDGNAEEVEKMIRIAICCLRQDPTRRPNMSTVVKALEGQTEMMVMELESIDSSNGTNSLHSSLEGSSSVSAAILSGPR